MLVLAGQATQDQVRRLARQVDARGLSGVVRIVPNVTEHEKLLLYQASDLFVAPYDGMQESFGLAPLEAMSVGLPVIASDWDGLRELVVDGVTGILVPTIAPHPSCLMQWPDLEHDERRNQFAHAQVTAVDIRCLRRSLERLMYCARVREEMGERARDHVRENYTRDHVSRRLQDVCACPFHEAKDPAAVEVAAWSTLHTSRFDVFSHYPTLTMDRATLVRRGDRPFEAHLIQQQFPEFGMLRGLVDLEYAVDILRRAGRVQTVADLCPRDPSAASTEIAVLTICWLVKHGFLHLAAAEEDIRAVDDLHPAVMNDDHGSSGQGHDDG